MFGTTKVKLEASLVDRVKKFAEIAGYSSVEEFITHALITFNVHQHVVSLVDFIDGISKLATAPVFLAMNFSTIRFDHVAISIDHAGNLFTLVRVHQKYDFVVTHNFPLGLSPLSGSGARRSVC